MKHRTRTLCVLLLLLGVAVCAMADDVTLGLVVSDGANDYVFAFPETEEYMFVQFGGNNASFGILTDTSLFSDVCGILATGLFDGFQTTGIGLLDRGISFEGHGRLGNDFQVGETLATFSFSTENGVMTERFEISDDVDGGYAFVQFLIDQVGGDLWIDVLNGYLLEDGGPILRMTSYDLPEPPAGGGGAIGQVPATIQVTIQNFGDETFSGPVDCAIGLSYATNWIPEWCTNYVEGCLGEVTLEPGEAGTYEVTIPAIPQSAIEELRKREEIWTGYEDPDPGQDYIGVHLCMNETHWCVFVPFEEQFNTTAMRKPKRKEGPAEE